MSKLETALITDLETWPETDEILDRFVSVPPIPDRVEFDNETADKALEAAEDDKITDCKSLLEGMGIKIGAMKCADKIRAKVEAAHAKHEKEQDELCDIDAAKAKAREKIAEKACLNGHLCRIYAWGVRDADFVNDVKQVPDPTREQETALVEELIDTLAEHVATGGQIMTWNGEGFDIPIIMQRAMILGVKVPFEVRMPLYYNDWSLDLMRLWSWSNRDFVRLGDASKALGLSGKYPTDGLLPWELCVKSPDRARDYLKRDMDVTWSVAERMLAVLS